MVEGYGNRSGGNLNFTDVPSGIDRGDTIT
jgi:hypothetical protein